MRKQAIVLYVLLLASALAIPAYASYTDAISREFSVYVDVPASQTDAISREFSVYVGVPVSLTDAISREFSVYAGAAPVVMAKRLPNNREVSLTDAAVSAAFPGYFYLESLERSHGIRVEWPSLVNVGDKVEIIGTTGTNTDFERYVAASAVSPAGTAQIKQLVMKNLLLGGGDFMYDPVTGRGQRGITGASSLNNIGLLVAIAGRVTASGTYPRLGISWFYADDGSGVEDGTGVKGVYAEAPISIAPPEEGAYVLATGVSSCDFYDEKLVNVLLIRTLEDITVFSGTGGPLGRAFASSSEEKPPPRLLIR